MLRLFLQLNPVYQSLIAGSFTFFITALGSALVFFFRKVPKTLMDGMMSISAGIMISASFFSLLNPAIDIANSLSQCTWMILFLGFLIGGLLLSICEVIFDHLSTKNSLFCSDFRRSIMLFLSITLHNIPEGLVLGVAFGAASMSSDVGAAVMSSIALTIGIAVQNFPEGSAISLPLRRDGASFTKSFLYGALSALVEPIFAVIGAILVLKIQIILPFIMAATAGAMIYVVLMELIPEVMLNKKKNLMTLLIMIGFALMMFLEIVLG